MKTGAVVLDRWKLSIFKKHLDAAGYKYEGPDTFSTETVVLRVYCEYLHELQPIIEAAQRECAQQKAH